MKYALVGYGKMGRAVEAAASQRGHARVLALTRGRWNAKVLSQADVAFEFTEPGSAEGNVVSLLASGTSVICGTTGWDPATSRVRKALLKGGAGLIAAPNFSVGMALFSRITTAAVRALAATKAYHPFVVEFHHRAKVDSPSGTALRLAELVQSGDPSVRSIHGGPLRGRLPEGAMQVVGIRAGLEEGTHTVGFDGEHDSIQLTHRARGRTGAALGAVLAAEWIRAHPGMHSFDDVLDTLLEQANTTTARGTRRQAKARVRKR